MTKRKLLLIHETMCGGGAERVLVDILRHMDYDRYEVTLLLVCATGVYMDQIDPRVRVLWINRERKHTIERVLFRCKPLLDRLQSHLINKVLGKERFDVITSFMEGPAMVYHSMVTHRAPRNVTWVHIDLCNNHWSLLFHGTVERERARYGLMDQVVCVSQGVRDSFEALLGPHRNCVVQHNPINRDAIIAGSGERASATRRFTLCNVARFFPEKRQDRIIDAVALLRERGVDVDVWMLGTGPLEKVLKKKVEDMGLSDRVKFWGFCPNPYPAMRSAHALLLTSDAEGYPTVVCEALCLGKPVITTRVAGASELVGNDAGIVCDSTIEAIATAIKTLATHPDKLAQLAQGATQRGTTFDPKITMQHLQQLL